MTMNQVNTLYCHASIRPDGIAFIQGEDAWSYERLTIAVNHLARGLINRGVQKGERVALHMHNVPELAIAYYACFKIGAIAATLDTQLTVAELTPILRRLQPVLYIGQTSLYREIIDLDPSILASDARYVVGDNIPSGQAWNDLLDDNGSKVDDLNFDVNAPAVLLCTWDPTDGPKFITHTLNTMSATAELSAHARIDGDQVVMVAMPMVHASGFAVFFAAMWCGAQIILIERFNTNAVLDAVELHRVTWFAGLPLMLPQLIECQRKQPRETLSLQTCIVISGETFSPRVQQDFDDHFGTPLHLLCGSTEALGSLTFGLERGSMSRVVHGAEVRLANEHGISVQVGEIGELLIRGSNVTVGYWDAPGVIRDATEGGWYRTGDLMREDDKGNLWFVARKKDMIVGGSNNLRTEIECAPVNDTVLKYAGMVGIPNDLLGLGNIGYVQLLEAPRAPQLRGAISRGGEKVRKDWRSSIRSRIMRLANRSERAVGKTLAPKARGVIV